jgi:hypothetical protein
MMTEGPDVGIKCRKKQRVSIMEPIKPSEGRYANDTGMKILTYIGLELLCYDTGYARRIIVAF